MRKQQRFSLHCLPGCGTIAVLRQGSTTMKTTAMTAEERVRYMTQAPVRRLILKCLRPRLSVCCDKLCTIWPMAGFKHRWWPPRGRDCFIPGRLYPAKSFRAIPHNSKCRYGERGAADARPKAQIILDAAKVSAASGGNSEPKQGQRSQSAMGFCPRSTMRGTATRHYRAFWQRRCRAAAAGAVLKPQGGNCAVLP